MSSILTPSQITEAMVEYVRANLQLRGLRESGSNKVMTFSGRGLEGEDSDLTFALEVIIQHEKALSHTFFDRILQERSAPRPIRERTYSGFLFPKSIDYRDADILFEGPYFKQARLLPNGADPDLKAQYAKFGYWNVKDLSRIEWEFAIPSSGSRIAYYNPFKGTIQVHEFQKFPEYEPIPDNRPLSQYYLWQWLRIGRFPSGDNGSRNAKTFREIQQGLHDRVRRIIRSSEIAESFTLSRYGKCVAKIVPAPYKL